MATQVELSNTAVYGWKSMLLGVVERSVIEICKHHLCPWFSDGIDFVLKTSMSRVILVVTTDYNE
jgi:hypothetical protein